MNMRKLTIGLGIFCSWHFIWLLWIRGTGALDKPIELFSIVHPVEAVLFSVVMLLALEEGSMLRWLFVLPLAALANYWAIYWGWTGLVIGGITRALGVFDWLEILIGWGVSSAAGGLIYCGLLHLCLQPEFFSADTYKTVAKLGFLSAVPLALGEMFEPIIGGPWFFFFALGKLCWFLLFSFALVISHRKFLTAWQTS